MYKSNSIWITGAEGKIGSRLKKVLKKNTDYKIIATGEEVDVTDMAQVEQAFDFYKPNLVINCASLSGAAICEDNVVKAYKVNTLGARNVAVVSMQHNVKMIHLSTDDVFSGENQYAKTEFDVPTPSTIYGKSKYAGENFVRELNPKHLIIRSSWVYGHGNDDYFSYVLEKGKAGEKFEASINRISSPTCANDIVSFIVKMIPEKEYGIYHVSSEGICSQYQYATQILKNAGYDTSLVTPSTDTGEGHAVTTLLENLMLKMTGLYEMPQWEDALAAYMSTMKK